MRRDRQGSLIDLERLFAFVARLKDHPHAHERAEVLGLALERLRDVGHRAVIVVVEVTRRRASVPAFRPVRQERDRRVEDFERVGIVLDPDRLARPPKQEIGGVRAGFGIAVQKPGDNPRRSRPRPSRRRAARRDRRALRRPFSAAVRPVSPAAPARPAWPGRRAVSGAVGGSSAHADAPAKKAAIARLAKRARAGCRIAQF